MRHSWFVVSTAAGLAFDSLRAHKLRSALTLLGIIIGVASVVLVGAAIEGLGVYAEVSTANAFGANSYMIAQIANVGRITRAQRAAKLRENKQISRDDVEWLRYTTGGRILYSPYRSRPEDVHRNSFLDEGVTVFGVSAEFAEIRDLALQDGRFFTEQEERNRQFVAVIGQDVIASLFPASSPLGETIRIRGFDFRVIGTQPRLGSSGNQNQDNVLYIPFPAFTRLFGPDRSLSVYGRPRADSGLSFEEALDLTRVALRTRFHTKPGRDDNFDTLTPDAIRGFVDSILGLVAAVVVPVTCISLIVGGIVVMNIMLVSVTERTYEIGLRKAIGARSSDILLQFLIEAVMLASVGGAAGLAIGAGFAFLFSIASGYPLPVTLPYVVLALMVSTLTGVISGWYPARRAAALDPATALRAE